ncbi:hypothetical protein DAERI_020235 [Deinococcus aerius]|uniref:YtkA-like domain-containing protein n=2 Tax=Deinococcus TaxID=1298 RepID=A0A2I9DF42_9DEIO|nr:MULTISPECIES: hypothetical protein [Deinococcus]MBB5293901.1 hypothetical protein [Deinococcus metallilatus]QBY07154.1 hypothetical protein E5F05_04010 [Deinococcus metallilatus]RXJ14626.1 hypothetical protein ERJ73_02740 [Deinococcus metallilatus]TLK30746.1 hypothetical protein FCS05_03055 [Deinococcus metallilatus]GBF04638.1 hypothetical protein DAERI_020235 [Deinococcus aerius]
MRRLALLLAVLLAPGALAHSEPVTVTAALAPLPDAVRVEASLVGQTSGLPIRGAAVEVLVSRGTGTPGRANDVPETGVLGRAKLTAGQETGQYTGDLAPLPAGRYVLTVVDTTYRGEAAVAGRPFAFVGQPTRVAVVLPVTSTPGRYVGYALLGLLAPPLLLGLVLGARRLSQRRAA